MCRYLQPASGRGLWSGALCWRHVIDEASLLRSLTRSGKGPTSPTTASREIAAGFASSWSPRRPPMDVGIPAHDGPSVRHRRRSRSTRAARIRPGPSSGALEMDDDSFRGGFVDWLPSGGRPSFGLGHLASQLVLDRPMGCSRLDCRRVSTPRRWRGRHRGVGAHEGGRRR